MMEGTTRMPDQRKKIHPHKLAMWIAIGTMMMMFGGLTSGYIVRKAQGDWRYFDIPPVFYVSTAVILISSFTLHFGIRAFKKRMMPRFQVLITTTLALGILFGILQVVGFYTLYDNNIRVDGNVSESFLYVMSWAHLLHILGGIIALLIVFFRAFRTRVKVYNATGLEIVASFWHFVDILWIYLFVFFLANQ